MEKELFWTSRDVSVLCERSSFQFERCSAWFQKRQYWLEECPIWLQNATYLPQLCSVAISKRLFDVKKSLPYWLNLEIESKSPWSVARKLSAWRTPKLFTSAPFILCANWPLNFRGHSNRVIGSPIPNWALLASLQFDYNLFSVLSRRRRTADGGKEDEGAKHQKLLLVLIVCCLSGEGQRRRNSRRLSIAI